MTLSDLAERIKELGQHIDQHANGDDHIHFVADMTVSRALIDLAEIFSDFAAQAGVARRAETTQIGSVHEHAVPEGNAP